MQIEMAASVGKLLIDADSILFKAACVMKDKGTEDRYLDKQYDVNQRVKTIINEMIADCFSDDIYVAIKGFKNFRYDIFKDYKANRQDKPLGDNLRERLNGAYKYIKNKYNAVPADGMEADDLIAIWATEAREAEEDYIVCHIDKDLNQIPGNHYNYNKREIYFVNDDEADMNFCCQLLTGDGGDNIPKLRKGLGIKTAEKILANTTYENRMDKIVDEYKRGYGKGWQERLNLVGNLLWMKRTFSEEMEFNYEHRINNIRETDDSESDVGSNTERQNDSQISIGPV